MGQYKIQIGSCLKQLTTRASTCHSSKIVCWDVSHTYYASIMGKILLHPVLEHGARVKDNSVLSSKSASECCRISVCSKLENIFVPALE